MAMQLSSDRRLQLPISMVPNYLRLLSVHDQALVTSPALDDVAMSAWETTMCTGCVVTNSEFDSGRIVEAVTKSLPAELLQVLAWTSHSTSNDGLQVQDSIIEAAVISGLEAWQDSGTGDPTNAKDTKAKKKKADKKKKKDKKNKDNKCTSENRGRSSSGSESCSDNDEAKKENVDKKKKKGKKKEKKDKDRDDRSPSGSDSGSDSDKAKKEKVDKKKKKGKKKDKKDKDRDDRSPSGSDSGSDSDKAKKEKADKKKKKDKKKDKKDKDRDDRSSSGSDSGSDSDKAKKKKADKKKKKDKKKDKDDRCTNENRGRSSSGSESCSDNDKVVTSRCQTRNLTAKDFPEFLRFLVALRIYSYFETPCYNSRSRTQRSPAQVPNDTPELEMSRAEADDFVGPTVVFIIGGPGTGKRTFGDRIAAAFGHVHLRAGGLIQQAMNGDDAELSASLRSAFQECRLVPSNIVVKLILRAIREHGWNDHKYVISGFPRGSENLHAWKAAANDTVRVKFLVNLECSEGVMEARQLARGLKDYSVEKIRQRFVTFYHETLPVIEECKSMGKLRRIDTEKDIEVVWKQVRQLFAPSVVFVLGASGSGKSTLCSEISRRFRYRRICLRELFSEELDRLGTEHSGLISRCLRERSQVPSALAVQVLRKAMERHGWESGKFLLDGFPRSLEDYSVWLAELGSHVAPKYCLFLECDDAVMDARRLESGNTIGQEEKDSQAMKSCMYVSNADLLPLVDRFESEGILKRIRADRDSQSVLEDVIGFFKPSVILVLGGPGAGKKAICHRVAELTGYHHLNTSELLRAEQDRPGSKYGKIIEKHVKEGTIVPTDITVRILSRAMMTHGWEEGRYLISAFPRCLDHLQNEVARKKLWEKVSIRCCLFLECSERVMEEHIQSEIGRGFDPEKQRNRIRTFQEDILPVVKKFEVDGLLRKVNAEQDRDHVLMCAQEVLKWELQLHVRNHALVLIKPHAYNGDTMRFVKSHFATHQVSVRIEGSASTTNFDAQYSQILRYANDNPHELFVPPAGQDAFKSAFGICWAEALADHQVVGAITALALLGISSRELMDLCARSTSAKLAPSMQVAKILADGREIFVVNGFLPHFRESFSCGMEEMHWLVVEFSTKDLSWQSFRKEVLGATDPSQAPETSIRGQFYKHWAALGMKAAPDILNNCIHASAGPLEALRERILWTNVSVYDDPLGRMLLASGVPVSILEAWFDNPDVFGWRRGHRVISGPVFDCTEESNTREFCVSAVDHERTSSRGAPLVYWPVEVVSARYAKGVLKGDVASPMSSHFRAPSRICSDGSLLPKPEVITILHFNDVYNVEPRKKEPVGGVARFVTRIKELKREAKDRGEPEAICLFSGDAFNPSLTSTITKGKHMVEALNAIGIDAACYGNHDFDFGVENLIQMKNDTNFPWLISNAHDRSTGQPLANGEITRMLDVDGRKLGLIGLIEREWLSTLHTLEPDDVDYEEFCPCARRLARQLRKDGADVVIAMTHMRMPNDYLLAHEVEEVDIILGGHDHHYEVSKIGPHGTYILNSGTDFRDLTAITLRFNDKKEGGCTCEVTGTEHVEITASITEHLETKVFVDRCLEKVSAGMDVVIGQTAVDLDCRFSMIRTQETNIGNFVADIMRVNMRADIALLNSGTLRADAIIAAGSIRMRDLISILPMLDELCLLQLTGDQVKNVLENSVSMYPRLEGRFAQVSGVTFTFDASRPGGDRIIEGSIRVGEELLDPTRNYKVTNLNYLRQGKDGYGVLKEAICLADGEQAGILPTMVKDFFHDMSALNGYETDAFAVHRASTIMRQGKLVKVGEGPEAMQIYAIQPIIEGRVECLNPVLVS